jgi:hypothetical protein
MLLQWVTAWSSQDVVVTQLIKKFPAFHYRVYNSPPLDPILSQMIPLSSQLRLHPRANFSIHISY